MIFTQFSRNRGSDCRVALSAGFWHTFVVQKVPANSSLALDG